LRQSLKAIYRPRAEPWNEKKGDEMGDKGKTQMPTQTALMDTVFYDDTPAYEGEECEIRIDNEEIVVSYKDDGGVVLYKGRDHGHGHFILECPELQGKATLHQIPQSRFLEGYWIEEGTRGFWRITLP